jgi:hypothetical protein
MVMTILSDHPWQVWRFDKKFRHIRGDWSDQEVEHLRVYFDWLIATHKLSGPLELAKKRTEFFKENHGGHLNSITVKKALRLVYKGA